MKAKSCVPAPVYRPWIPPAGTQPQRQLGEIPARLERLQKSGLKKVSRSDEDSRFLRQRGGFVLGYTAPWTVREDHLIVAQQVNQATNDTEALLPMVDAGETMGRATRWPECAQRIFQQPEFAPARAAEHAWLRTRSSPAAPTLNTALLLVKLLAVRQKFKSSHRLFSPT